MVTTRSAIFSPITLHGRRIVLRTMNEQDYEAFVKAIRSGRLQAVEGV